MQKKKINKILILVVVLIWGVVIYKFIAPYFSNTDETVITADALVSPSRILIRKKDTFDLITPERDPFLGKTSQKILAIQPKLKLSKKKVRSTPLSTTWPKIEYLGFIKSNNSSSKLGLLRVNGVLKRIRKGAKLNDIIIKSIAENKIVIQLGREEKDFMKK